MAEKTKPKTTTAVANKFWGTSRGGAEWFMLMVWAILLDIAGLFSLIFLDDYWILDFLGIFTIGAYDWVKTGNLPMNKKAKEFFLGKGKKLKWLEFVPFVGSIGSFWTIYVYTKAQRDPSK